MEIVSLAIKDIQFKIVIALFKMTSTKLIHYVEDLIGKKNFVFNALKEVLKIFKVYVHK